MRASHFNFDQLRNVSIGTVDYVSPNEIKVLLETDAPKNTALNTGVPSLFPRINGFVLIPNEVGALVGIISWLGVEHSQFPKRSGFRDYDLIDLPFPLRKMSVHPLGTLKTEIVDKETVYKLERGIYSFPSVGDTVVLPKDEQLKAIVENDDEKALIRIGTAPIAGNAIVRFNPDRLFGRHVAILGNTGSGKSCSVAGIIRWSLEKAIAQKQPGLECVNARFLILDPNGEYAHSFDDINLSIKRFKVEITEQERSSFQQLRVPAWIWNSYEWSSFTMATGKTQRPILRRSLRELRSGAEISGDDFLGSVRGFFSSCLVSLRGDINKGVSAYHEMPGRFEILGKLRSISKTAKIFAADSVNDDTKADLENIADILESIEKSKYAPYTKSGKQVDFYNGFDLHDMEAAYTVIKSLVDKIGGESVDGHSNEDTPIEFDINALPSYLEFIAKEQGVLQFLDFLIMRIKTLLADNRMKNTLGNEPGTTLEEWLNTYVDGITIIDLSLIPPDIIHIVVASISRITFEAIQRYRRLHSKVLPTVLVMEEAHNFIKKQFTTSDEITPLEICSQTFEKIAKEGRKFGLGLVVSSQRPSELSETVLSQCNTYLLHRLVNDRDQDLVRRLVPDNIGGLLDELPMLPSQKAILLGWASPIPVLVDMRDLERKYQPSSSDPDFWDVWTGVKSREVNWKDVVEEWTRELNKPSNSDVNEGNGEE